MSKKFWSSLKCGHIEGRAIKIGRYTKLEIQIIYKWIYAKIISLLYNININNTEAAAAAVSVALFLIKCTNDSRKLHSIQ